MLTPLFLFSCKDPPLTHAQRAAEIRDLADGRTSSSNEAEIEALLTEISGPDLRAVKRLLDVGEEDLHHIVYSDIDDTSVQERLFAHLARSTEGLDKPTLRLLSDIDDTVTCTLIDDRYPKFTTYPGVRAFYRELAAAGGSRDLPVWLTFVSARPADRLELVEETTAKTLSEAGFSAFTVLSGTFSGLVSHEAMAETKYARFLEHRRLWPEEQHIFIGDDGQGDPEFGARMLSTHGDVVKAVFIHDVVSDDGTEDRTPDDQRAQDAQQRLYRFDTYAGAARQAMKLGLMPEEAAARVIAEARQELAAIPFPDDATKSARLAELEADAAR